MLSQLPVKNGGSKVAQRIAFLTTEIEALKALLPQPAIGMRVQNAGQPSLMVPINSPATKVGHPILQLHRIPPV